MSERTIYIDDNAARRLKAAEAEIDELRARVTELEAQLPEDPDDMMLLEVTLKEIYMRGYVTGKFGRIEHIEKSMRSHDCDRYHVRGYALRKNVPFIVTHASWVGMQPKLHKRKGDKR